MLFIVHGRHRALLIQNLLTCYVCGQVLWESRAQQGFPSLAPGGHRQLQHVPIRQGCPVCVLSKGWRSF
eukprot:1418032-Pyramimonas_sp.AAC.1